MSIATPVTVEVVTTSAAAHPNTNDNTNQDGVDIPEKDINVELDALKGRAVKKIVSGLKATRENLVFTTIWLVLASEPDKSVYWVDCTEPYNNGNSNKYLCAVKVCTDGGQDIPASTLTNMSYVVRFLYNEVKDIDIKDDKTSFDFIMKIFKENGHQKGCIEKLFGKKDLLKSPEPLTRYEVDELITSHKEKSEDADISEFDIDDAKDYDETKLVVMLGRYSNQTIHVLDSTQADGAVDYLVRKLHK